MTYQQLTRDERYMIGQLRRQGCGLSEMARLMGRNRSTIWRELKRNMIQTRHGLGGARIAASELGSAPEAVAIPVAGRRCRLASIRPSGGVWKVVSHIVKQAVAGGARLEVSVRLRPKAGTSRLCTG